MEDLAEITAGDFTVCLDDGEHIFTGYDSWGDGWNGASFTISAADGVVVATGAVSGSSESFSCWWSRLCSAYFRLYRSSK